jgi:hypothetical protein
LKLLHGPNQIGHQDVTHRFSRSGSRLNRRIGEWTGMIFGSNHSANARTIGSAQTGTEISGVSHAIKQQQAWRFFTFNKQIVKTEAWKRFSANRHKSLMPPAGSKALNALTINRMQLDPLPLGKLNKLAHARVASRIINVDRFDRIGLALEPGQHGMKALKSHIKSPETSPAVTCCFAFGRHA